MSFHERYLHEYVIELLAMFYDWHSLFSVLILSIIIKFVTLSDLVDNCQTIICVFE